MQKLKRFLKWALGLIVIFIIMLYSFQEKLIFHPTTLDQNYSFKFSAPAIEFNLNSPDGAKLNALHFKQENPKGIILYFHGNAGDLSRWGYMGVPFAEKGYDVIIMDYRTYGKSTGKLSEAALHADAVLFYEYVNELYPNIPIILYGRSLGTGIATRLASVYTPDKLILETPYYSLLDVAKKHFPFLPLKWLLKYRFDSYSYIQKVSCPITIFHGTDDTIVPYTSGKKLYDAIPHQNRKLITIDGGEHNNLAAYEAYHKGLLTALNYANKSEDK